MGEREEEEARRLCGEVETPPRASGGANGWSVVDGRRQRVEGEVAPCRSSSPAVETRPKSGVSTEERVSPSDDDDDDVVDGAEEASRRRRGSDDESITRDIGEEGRGRGSKRSRG